MKRFHMVLLVVILALLQLNLTLCSEFSDTTRRTGTSSSTLKVKSTRFSEERDEREAALSNSIVSDKTDSSDEDDLNEPKKESLMNEITADPFGSMPLFSSSRDGGVLFGSITGIDFGLEGGSCYGGGKFIKKSFSESDLVVDGGFELIESRMEGSGLTSNPSDGETSRRPSVEFDVANDRFVVSGSWPSLLNAATSNFKKVWGVEDREIGPTAAREEDGFSSFNFGELVISETCSVASDGEKAEEDCFEGWPIYRVTTQWIFDNFIPYLQSGKRLERRNVLQIIEYAKYAFVHEKAIVDVTIEKGEVLCVVGDIHGQFEDLIRIFEQNGLPGFGKKFIFNGDLVDRGPNSLECLLTLFLMKIAQPSHIFITRGNHESMSCGDGTFKVECLEKMDEEFFFSVHEVFDILPLGYIINEKFFVCHGGLPDHFNPNELKAANKPRYTAREQDLGYALLWNDPHEGLGMRSSRRGGSTLEFGWDVTFAFLKRNGFDLLIRSHEYHHDGYFYCHNDLCLTVFSAPNYCGIGNKGTVIRIESDLRYSIVEIVTSEPFSQVSVSTYMRREKERSMTLIAEDHEFVFLKTHLSELDNVPTNGIEAEVSENNNPDTR